MEFDTSVPTLGNRTVESPLTLNSVIGDNIGNFVPEEASVHYEIEEDTGRPVQELLFQKAGPREHLFFDPKDTTAAIVTCGGLCPGLNNVIRSAYLELTENYGVSRVLGLRYGFEGLNAETGMPPLELTLDRVERIHEQGGTILGSSRGAQEPSVMVDFLEQQGISILLCVGGDGTQRGAHAIAEEITRRGAKISVIGIPKTIDNDIQYVHRTFGFYSAIDKAREVLQGAHAEAKSAYNGIGLVKLMGRDSGFIACGATQVSQDPNFCLIPEVPFSLEVFFTALEERLVRRGHAVIAIAEGAGQELMPESEIKRDKSGNKLHQDIGPFMAEAIKQHFKARRTEVNLKYIDPSYYIRSVPSSSADSMLCDQYARHAVHAGMAGKTDIVIGYWNNRFIHVPIPMATSSRRKVEPEGELWNSVIALTGQPRVMV